MIDRNQLRIHCNAKPGVEETFPFGEGTLVFKVMGKMFALLPLDLPEHEPQTISLKCNPTLAELLRQTYDAVQPGYHLNKKHWNTVTVNGSIPDDEVMEMIDNSYALVVQGLKKADREKLRNVE